MLLLFNSAGRQVGTLDAPYPAPPDQMERVAAGGQTVIDVPPFEPAYWYLDAGEPRIRPRLTYQMTETADEHGRLMTFTGLPAGTTVAVSGTHSGTLVADDEPTTLHFLTPGEYRVTLTLDPYQPEALTVQVTGAES